MRNLLGQVETDSMGRQESAAPAQDRYPPLQPDADLGDVMGAWTSPKRFGHYGLMSDVSTIAYEPTNGVLAVSSRGGMVKVFGAAGVELVLEESYLAFDDPPSHLIFSTPQLLVGVTATGSVLVWDVADGRRCGHVSCPLDLSGAEERVTAVHSPSMPSSPANADIPPAADRYVYIGLESGRVRIAQVLPICRMSGYVVEPRDIASGAPEELQAPGSDSGGVEIGGGLGAVTAIASSGERDGGALVLIGHRHGGIVLWDVVRRKRLALHGLAAVSSNRDGEEGDGDGDREVTSLAFHPSGIAFAAGFASGCYALCATASRDLAPPRWVHEVGDDGSYPREGPTIVRTAVSFITWVGVRQGEGRAWGLLVAGGVEIEEGEEPDGVSLLVPPPGEGKARKQSATAVVLATLETAAFVPFAIGQERLSCVHPVVCGSAGRVGDVSTLDSADEVTTSDEACDGASGIAGSEVVAGGYVEAVEELIVIGLVEWTEEVRGDNGRLYFRRASSVQACPIQIAPYLALLQLAPERFGPHLSGLAPVTTIATTPLLSSSTIHNFVTCLGISTKGRERCNALSSLLRGGGLQWAESIQSRARDEAICTAEMLVVGHSNGFLSFWECCGPASPSDGVCISDGRMTTREVPSGATLLGLLPASDIAVSEGATSAVTALDLWVERDHVAAAERDACWVAVGFDSGDAAVLVLSSRLKFDVDDGRRGDADPGGATPLAEKPVAVSNVDMRNAVADNGDQKGKGWTQVISGLLQPSEKDDDFEDKELEAAIAEARAEATAIQAQGEGKDEDDGDGDEGGSDDLPATITEERGPVGEGEEAEKQELESQESKSISQVQGAEPAGNALENTDVLSSSPSPPLLPTPLLEAPKENEASDRQKHCVNREVSLVQLALSLHAHAVRCVALSFDTRASALALIVADAEGVVSVTDVATGAASLLPMRAPQVRPCYPAVTIGPLPDALRGGTGRRGNNHQQNHQQQQRRPQHGAAGALFVFLEGWLNVFDLASRDPVDVVEVPGLAIDGGRSGQSREMTNSPVIPRGRSDRANKESWLFCVDERGVPLVPYALEPLSTFTPSRAHGGAFRQEPRIDEATGNDEGCSQESTPRDHHRHRNHAQTIWVSPSASRTALEGYQEHELQMVSGLPPPVPFLLVVSGAVAATLTIAEREVTSSPFSRRPSASPNVAMFKGRSGAELVVKSRVEMPPAEGRAPPPRVDRAGLCILAAGGDDVGGKVGRRGCVIATDISGFATGLLLPSLTPVFRDWLPLGEEGSMVKRPSGVASQNWTFNLVGELTICGAPEELTRWSVLTDEARDAVMGSKPRLIKISTLRRSSPSGQLVVGNRQPSDGGSSDAVAIGSGGLGGVQQSKQPKQSGRSNAPRRMLKRLSLGGSKKSLADVFAVEPPSPPAPQHNASVGSTRSSGVATPTGVFSPCNGRGGHTGGNGGNQSLSTDPQTRHRRALFGEQEQEGRGAAAGDAAGATARARSGVSGAHAAVSEAHDLAVQRGEKLESLVDKSRQLEDSALAFGDMAKQLRRQQEAEACCIA